MSTGPISQLCQHSANASASLDQTWEPLLPSSLQRVGELGRQVPHDHFEEGRRLDIQVVEINF